MSRLHNRVSRWRSWGVAKHNCEFFDGKSLKFKCFPRMSFDVCLLS